MKRTLALALACAAAIAPAHAERADKDKPLNYEANSGECDDLKQVCVLVGGQLDVERAVIIAKVFGGERHHIAKPQPCVASDHAGDQP